MSPFTCIGAVQEALIWLIVAVNSRDAGALGLLAKITVLEIESILSPT